MNFQKFRAEQTTDLFPSKFEIHMLEMRFKL